MQLEAHQAYHAYLLNRMADVLGVDIGQEVDLAHVSRHQVETAIKRCTECANSEGCKNWIDEHAAGARNAPQTCRNKRLLEYLRGGY